MNLSTSTFNESNFFIPVVTRRQVDFGSLISGFCSVDSVSAGSCRVGSGSSIDLGSGSGVGSGSG